MTDTYGMTYTEMITAANTLTKEAMSNAEAVIWLNAWLADMAKVSRYAKEATILLLSGTTVYTIPDDCREIHGVFHVSGETYTLLDKLPLLDKTSRGWKVVDGKLVVQELTFSTGDTLSVTHFARFPTIAVADLANKPTKIPAEFHNSGTFYVANRHQFREKWENAANWLYALYLDEHDKYASQQNSQAWTGRISARPWR